MKTQQLYEKYYNMYLKLIKKKYHLKSEKSIAILVEKYPQNDDLKKLKKVSDASVPVIKQIKAKEIEQKDVQAFLDTNRSIADKLNNRINISFKKEDYHEYLHELATKKVNKCVGFNKVRKGQFITYNLGGGFTNTKYTWYCEECGKEWFSREQAKRCRNRGHVSRYYNKINKRYEHTYGSGHLY